jgi:diacylglycerol kinase
MGFYFHISEEEWLIILVFIGAVISSELINSSIENLTDLVTKEQLPLAGKVKDISAAAVLVLSFIALIAGLSSLRNIFFN